MELFCCIFENNQFYHDKLLKYFIVYSDDFFWKTFDWFQNNFYHFDPLNTALFDLNRYYKSARVNEYQNYKLNMLK